jgi:ADP-dependent NAD(P)H-hydrate dehydratase / NAD(P)H-hydrate epimerase
MKIFPIEKVREADAYTIKNEPIASIDLMERAANQLFAWMKKRIDKTHLIHIFVGLGNNGGDGLVLARLLLKKAYPVKVYVIRFADKSSEDFQINYDRLYQEGLSQPNEIKSKADLPKIQPDDIIVDAIFGSGLTRPVSGLIGEVIDHINGNEAVKIAIDVPSGLLADDHSDPKKGAIVRADYTLSFQFPKLAFFMPENDRFVGHWTLLDIGLMSEYINKEKANHYYMQKRDIIPMLKRRKKFDHKGNFGHALLIAGGYGKMGAAILASKACLRSGVGLLHTHIPKSAIQIMQTATPETMLSIDRYDNYFSEIPNLGPYDAVGIGPGLGKEKQSQMALKLLIQESGNPVVFDADALNILSENKTWLAFLPKGSILTPHPKEFERLAGKWSTDFEKLDLLKNFCFKNNVHIVLKGANTAVCFPDGNIYFNSTGNPGMATAGSGDVLTGLITGLLAQGYSPGIAAVLGVYIHGLAGDIAAKKTGVEALLAGDIIENIGNAFKRLV